MYLREADVLRLLASLPYLKLAKPRSAKQYIAALVRDGVELEAVLRQFPTVQYEPLDQHYVLCRCLSRLSDELISDLCSEYDWRGIVWAAFLVALAPDSRYKKYLVAARDHVPNSRWLIDLALAEIESLTWQEDTELQVLIHRLRALLFITPLPQPVLRRSLNADQLAEINVERERVRLAYHAGGVEAAHAVLRNSEILYELIAR